MTALTRPFQRCAGLAALGLLVSACGGGGTATPSASSAAPPAVSTLAPDEGAGQIEPYAPLAGRITAAMKQTHGVKVALTDDTPGAATSAAGVLQTTGQGYRAQFTITNGAETIKEILIPGTIYLSGPGLADGKKWVKIEEDGSDPVSKARGPVLALVASFAKPEQALAVSGEADVIRAGQKQVNGVDTKVYLVRRSGEDALKALPPAAQEVYRSKAAQLSAITQVYVDGAGLPRRITTVTTVGEEKLTQTLDYTDWNAGTAVDAPPKAQTVDVWSIIG